MESWSRVCAVSALVIFGQFVVPSAATAAGSCPSTVRYDFSGGTYFPSDTDLGGVRAPIQLVKSGTACSPVDGFVATWVSIVFPGTSGITQIGSEHDVNQVTDTAQYCRFWAIGTGTPHDYGCGSQTDQQYVFFKIKKFYDPVYHKFYYDVGDCGAGNPTYAGCTSRSSSQVAYSEEESQAEMETDYGGPACTLREMGLASQKLNIGTGTNYLEIMGDYAGAWGTRDWITNGPDCGQYRLEQFDTFMRFWDARN